MREEL